MRKTGARAFIVASMALFMAGVAPQAKADPVKIRAGWISAPASLIPILFLKEGLAKHNGKSYAFEPVYFSSSALEITSLAVGELDIATMGFSTLPLAVSNAGLGDLRVIADELQDGAHGGFSLQFMVRKDSTINSFADLKGKVLATIGIGSGAYAAMTAYLRKNGLQEQRDYTLIETPFPTMKAVLKDRKADLVTVTTGFANDPELQSIARTLFRQQDGMGGSSELSFWAAREAFIQKNRAAMVDLLEDTARATRWYMDPANRPEMLDLMSKALKLPRAQLDSWIFKKTDDVYRDPDIRPDLEALQRNVDLMRDLSIVKQSIEVKNYADLAPLNEAIERLK